MSCVFLNPVFKTHSFPDVGEVTPLSEHVKLRLLLLLIWLLQKKNPTERGLYWPITYLSDYILSGLEVDVKIRTGLSTCLSVFWLVIMSQPKGTNPIV